MDETPPGCIPSNSRSVATWSKTLTPVKSTSSLHHNLRGCDRREVYDSAIVQLNQHL
jgi:hypothetical protein